MLEKHKWHAILQGQGRVASQLCNATPQHIGTTDTLQNLPTPVLLHLVTVLPPNAHFHLALTCKHFYTLVLEATGAKRLKELIPNKDGQDDNAPSSKARDEFAVLRERWMWPRWKKCYICRGPYVRTKERMCLQCEFKLRDVL